MKFIKGMIVGGIIAAGAAMICADGMCSNKKKMIKRGKQFARKMGML
jgi:gas vesicle protein